MRWFVRKEQADPLDRYVEYANRLAGGGSYEWLLDYAKFRSRWLIDLIRSIEGRAVGMLKGLAVGIGAVWTVLVWGTSKLGAPPTSLVVLLAVSALSAIAAVLCCALVLIPRGHRPPAAEDAAFESDADPIGALAALNAYTNGHQLNLADAKGRCLRWAYGFVGVTLGLLLASFLAALLGIPAGYGRMP